MESKVVEMFLHAFSMATHRYEEVNIKLNVQGPMKKLYSTKIPKTARVIQAHLKKKDSNRGRFPTLEGCQYLEQDDYNPFIRTIQRAVQLRSFMERLVIETMVPKAMRSKKDAILTLKGYQKHSKTIKNPNDEYARKLVIATEKYRKMSMDAEKQFSNHEEALQRTKDAATLNAKGIRLMRAPSEGGRKSKKGTTNTNIVKAKENFAAAVHKDGAQYMYHLNLGEACHILGFHRDASGAFLKGIKLRAGQELFQKSVKRGLGKADLENKIKELTAQYQADLEEQKEQSAEQVKTFISRKKNELVEVKKFKRY
eukprot:TRINITY_DN3707_c0_g1_i1.p1 TRINITY_DN3707_c0_g1~~TRINITY_DN3707_c0_g1_i1.p1  ORF type:complete len:359 (+),score=62.01 TRINITY_DN3707_c0_g1_i1:144-1079(+)